MGQHGLARAGRADQQHGMAAGGGNLQGALGLDLALDLGQIQQDPGRLARWRQHALPARAGAVMRGGTRGQQLRHHIQQVGGTIDLGLRGAGRLGGAVQRQHQACRGLAPGQGQAGGQGPAHRAQLAGQRQLTRELPAVEPCRIDLPAGGQDAQGDGQVEAAGILGQVGRRQVHGDALVGRKFQAAVDDGAAHALAGFLDLHVGQPHQGQAGQAVGQMHFHGDGGRLQPQKGTTLDASQAHGAVLPQKVHKKAAHTTAGLH